MGLIKLPDNSIEYFQNNILEIFKHGNLAEGNWIKILSNYVTEVTGARSAIPTNSNGAGLVAIMTYLRFYQGRSNVMIQSNTMYGVKTMIPTAGCDLNGYIGCELETLMPSYFEVERAIGSVKKSERKKQIILLSHIGGIINPDIVKISEICKTENIILLEDCAHSFGATLNQKHSGLFGDAGVYSFYATKAIPAGEGGVVVTNNPELGDNIYRFTIYDRFDQQLEVGNNIRISEIQALFTYSVVKEWKNIIANKNEIAKEYIKICKERNISFINQGENGQKGNYYKFIIYNHNQSIKIAYPGLETVTSSVYDYSLFESMKSINNHACLPIWYGQEMNVTEKVISELS